jgi:conjugative relaxase-like TrwC/TraI family protein
MPRTAMLTGHNPATGEPLGLRAVGGRGAVPGFDLTFSVPKSASLLWALGDTHTAAAVRESVDRSLEAALGYLQREACFTRRGADAEFVKGNGFLTAAFPHRSSRAGDPQVHVHALIANATQGPDGKWTRLYHPAIYEHAKAAGYIFEAHFRHELTARLGVGWQEVRNGIAEIAGFGDRHLREFSTRRQQILEAAGPEASARSRQIATLATRTAKEEVAGETLRERWQAKAEEIGLTPDVIAETMRPERTEIEPTRITVAELGREVTAHASHFDRREAVQAVAQLLPDGAPAHEVEAAADAFLRSSEVVRIAEAHGAKGERFTTRHIWELERKAMASAGAMAAQSDRALAGERIAANVISLRPSLEADQREMVARLLTGGEGLTVVIGEAGTGKTYATVAAAEGWAAAGIELRVAAPTWRAANVLRSEGLEATSIARLLAQLDRAEASGEDGLGSGSVLLVDEAGMVDSASIARLIERAQAADAKLVLIGDHQQLPEIEAGGLFRALAQRTDPIHLTEVIRHRYDTDREGAKLIREGEGRKALALYESRQRVTIAADAEARRQAMVADWWQSFSRGEDAVMVAKRNAEVAELNEHARAAMKEAGRLKGEEIAVGDARFAAGDQVITRVNDHQAAIYNRERWEVTEVNATERTVTLRGIDQERTVQLDAAYLARTNRDAPALQHAYAVTTYSAQGTTVDRAFIAADPSMDKQELYVAASRAREETRIYATPEVQGLREDIAPRSAYLRDGIPHIAEAAERDRAQVAAHDLAELRALPDAELSRLARELAPHVRAEDDHARALGVARERIEPRRAELERAANRRERAEELPGREGAEAMARIEADQARALARLAEAEAEVAALGAPSQVANRQLSTIEAVIAERDQAAALAARLDTPSYVTDQLGERPTDPRLASIWDKGVGEIERYRTEHGITDQEHALGPKPVGEHTARRSAERRIRERQARLGREAGRAKGISRGPSLGR